MYTAIRIAAFAVIGVTLASAHVLWSQWQFWVIILAATVATLVANMEGFKEGQSK